MNCFQIIKKVLDETYEQIPADDKDAQIIARLGKFRDEFRGLLSGRNIDYSDPISRFAYLYAYVTSHANMVYQLISVTEELQALFLQKDVTVACVGGGPGSDLMGILKYVDGKRSKPRITCFLLDKNKTWNECWCDVGTMVETEVRLYTNFMELDVCERASYESFAKYLRADLFTFVYFISEIHCQGEKREPFFDNLVANMRPGALILFIDNNDSRFFEWFDRIAKKHGLRALMTLNLQAKMPTEEEKTDLGEYYEKFGSPKIQAAVAWRVVQREI